MLHKHEKKCSLLGRQNQFFAVFVKAHRGCFVAERTTFQRIVAVQNHVFIASDHCLDFGSEDEWTEWFGDIIIGTKRQPIQGIVVLTSSADNDDRSADALITETFDDFKSLHITEHDIHKYKIKGMIFEHR